MLVTNLSPMTKNRVKVTLDQEFSFVLYKGELCSYNIKEQEEISERNYRLIMEELLPKRAKLRAMNLLKVRPYSVKGLTDKLKDGGYPDKIIKIAIDYVSSYHYLDDHSYAMDYIYTYKDRKNQAKLTQDLLTKGIDKNTIAACLEESFEDDDTDYEEEQIKSFLRKKNYMADDSSYEEKCKLLSSLYRKGYNLEKVKKLLDITWDNY